MPAGSLTPRGSLWPHDSAQLALRRRQLQVLYDARQALGLEAKSTEGALGRCPIHQRANLIRIKRGVRVPVAARDSSCIRSGSSSREMRRSPLASKDARRSIRAAGDLAGSERRRPDRTSTAGRGPGACAAAAATPINWPPSSSSCASQFSRRPRYSTKGFENLGSVRNVRSVSVFRKATSAAFSDAVKFNGRSGIM